MYVIKDNQILIYLPYASDCSCHSLLSPQNVCVMYFMCHFLVDIFIHNTRRESSLLVMLIQKAYYMYSQSILYSTARSFRVGVPLAFFLGACATLYKDSKDNGWKFIPTNFKHEMGMIDTSTRYDFTLTKER